MSDKENVLWNLQRGTVEEAPGGKSKDGETDGEMDRVTAGEIEEETVG